MSDTPSHIPWPIWAAVTLCVSLIGAWAIMRSAANAQLEARNQGGLPETAPAQILSATAATGYERADLRMEPDRATESITFTIHDSIGSNQLYERVRIVIDGQHVGTLEVNQEHPSSTLNVHVPGPGRYSWTAQAEAIFVTPDGQTFTHSGMGQGIIIAESNSSFSLRAFFSGTTWSISLERDDRQ